MTEKPCIMPEMPYCPACKYGLILPIDETDCEWRCLYDGQEETETNRDAIGEIVYAIVKSGGYINDVHEKTLKEMGFMP